MKFRILLIGAQILSFFSVASQESFTATDLRCEYLQNPLGIETEQPRFFWEDASVNRNQLQSAYEIIVSDSEENIQKNIGNIWTSGKVASKENIQIIYNGKKLESFTRYYWKVRVYNQVDKSSGWSLPSWFETAMLSPADWKAKWISDGSKNPDEDEKYYLPDQMPLFRKSFSTNKKILSARLYITGLGYYEAYINGEKVGNQVLDPGFTTFSKEVLYSVYDITKACKSNNTLAVKLGNGWWNPLPFKFFGRWDLRDYQQTGRPCLIAEVHVKYQDGTIRKILSDETWLTTGGPVIRNNIYLGETYDARLEVRNWNNSLGDISSWKNAIEIEGPTGRLTRQMQPPVKVTKIIQPIKITSAKPDTFIVDMGQNFAGVARIKLKAGAGTKITLRYGEDIFPDGTLNYMTSVATQIKKGGIKGGPGAPETAWQEDVYICKGNGEEAWSPSFTFHGFRYVEITGWPGKPGLQNIEGLRMNADLENTGTFSCSNEKLNKLHDVIQWTFLSNVFSVQSDCPAREKMGYGGDMVATADAFIYNYQMAQFYSKAVNDFANEQRPEGGITEIAPFTGIADRGYGDLSGPLGWQLAFPFLQQKLYEYYGDKRIIENNYEAFNKQMDFLQSKAVDNLFYWDISDHEALDTKPEALTAAAFYYHHARLGEFFAGILNKQKDSLKYNKLSNQIKSNIIQKYVVSNTGRIDNATQSAQIFALWYGLSESDSLTWNVLLNEFERHNWHLSTGIFSTKMMFDVLRENNAADIAYKIVTQPDFPGWLNMLNNGATTLWETWAYPETGPSQNHPMFGSVDEWFYRSILGINSEKDAFGEILIKPQPPDGLEWAKGSYRSLRGLINAGWEKTEGKFTIEVRIPANTKAVIYIPNIANHPVFVNGDKETLAHEDGYSIFKCGSGNYTITSVFMQE